MSHTDEINDHIVELQKQIDQLKTQDGYGAFWDNPVTDGISDAINSIISTLGDLQQLIGDLSRFGKLPEQILNSFSSIAVQATQAVTDISINMSAFMPTDEELEQVGDGELTFFAPVQNILNEVQGALPNMEASAATAGIALPFSQDDVNSVVGSFSRFNTYLGNMPNLALQNSEIYGALNDAATRMTTQTFTLPNGSVFTGIGGLMDLFSSDVAPAYQKARDAHAKVMAAAQDHQALAVEGSVIADLIALLVGMVDAAADAGCRFVEDIGFFLELLVQQSGEATKDAVGVMNGQIAVQGGVAAGVAGSLKLGVLNIVELIKAAIGMVFKVVSTILKVIVRVAQSVRVYIDDMFKVLTLVLNLGAHILPSEA